MSEQDNKQLNMNNVSKTWDAEMQNNLVNETFSKLKGFSHVDLKGMFNIMNAPFSNSYMNKGSVIGGGYKLGCVELHNNEPYNNKAHILDELTIERLGKSSLEHLYFTNGIYATSKALVIEEANRFAIEHNCDEVRFSNNGKNIQCLKQNLISFIKVIRDLQKQLK